MEGSTVDDKRNDVQRCAMGRRYIWLLIAAAAAVLAALCYRLTAHCPEWVDRCYTQIIFRIINFPLKLAAYILPFSIGEVLLYLGICFFLFYTIRMLVLTIRALIRRQKQPYLPALCYAVTMGTAAFAAIACFILFGGLNYNSVTFADKAGYEIVETDTDELKALCLYLSARASEARAELPEDASGVVAPDDTVSDLLQAAKDGYAVLSERFPYLNGFYPDAKPALFSVVMCYTQITGIYPYLLPEPVVNAKTPIMSLPHTICHVMAHQRGFAREDEANYIAYLAAISNPDPVFVYSGYYTAFVYAMNALYADDPAAWEEVAAATEEGIFADMRYANQFWSRFETPNDIVANLSQKVNDTYLQANRVEDGVKSYGRVVDLLLAEYRFIQQND